VSETAQVVVRLQQRHLVTGVSTTQARRDPREPATDHCDSQLFRPLRVAFGPGALSGHPAGRPVDAARFAHAALPASARKATPIFSLPDNESRLSNTAEGCSAMRSSRCR